MRHPILMLLVLAACEPRAAGNPAADTTQAATADSTVPQPADSLALGDTALRADSMAPSRRDSLALPPLKRLEDSFANLRADAESLSVRIYPDTIVRGGVIVIRAPAANASPRCTWKGEAIPCYRAGSDIRAIIPLPADEPGGEFELTIEGTGAQPLRHSIRVEEREFDRQLVFLDAARHSLLRRGADIARDARALRRVLAGESPEQHWTGWRFPGANARGSGYGVERFYYRASDSSRVVSAGPAVRVSGRFGVDTTTLRANATPAWQHSGVDVPLARRTPIRAAANGTVVDVGDYVLTGRTVAIDHGQGVHTVYFHLDSALVRRGDVVQRGAVLGRVGETGLTTGPHLHYGVYVHGRDVDPTVWHGLPAAALR